MNLRNSPDRWGPVSQTLHWLVAVLIVVMAGLGLTMTDLPNTPFKIRIYSLHKSIGITVLGLAALRLAWRAYAGAPRELPATPRWQRRIAGGTHAGLYLLLFAVPLSGWAFNSAAGFPLPWFGLAHLPAVAPRSDGLRAVFRDWHEWLFWALATLVLLHAAAAVWHHLFPRDATLARMLPRGWVRSPDPPATARHEERP